MSNSDSHDRFKMFRLLNILAAAVWLILCYAYTEGRIDEHDTNYLTELRGKTTVRAARVGDRLQEQFRGMMDFADVFAADPQAFSLLGKFKPLPAAPPASGNHQRTFLTADPDAVSLSDYYRQVIADTDYNLIFLLDATGVCVASSNSTDAKSIVGESYADRTYFRDALASGTGQQFAVGRIVRVPAFFFARAVRGTDGRYLGVAVVRKTSNSLVDTVTSNGAQTWVTDENGVVVASNRADLVLRHVGMWGGATPAPNSQNYGGEQPKDLGILPTPIGAAKDLISWNGIRYIAAAKQLAHSPYSVWVAVPISAQTEIDRVLKETGIVAALAGLLAFFLLDRTLVHVRLRSLHASALTSANEALVSANARLSEMAQTDLLTGCSNRRHFIERAVESIALARRSGQPRTLLILDLDHFKKINDTHGHPVGDIVLIRTVQTCLDLCRSTDAFGRIGGEEFALFLWDTDEVGARLLAERLRTAIAALRIPHSKAILSVTVSIGIAQQLPREEFELLYSRADSALYKAKAAGRNCLAVA